MPLSKTTVGVVFGGASREHDVSIKSATTILNAFQRGDNPTKFKVILIYIDLAGRWWPNDVAQKALLKGNSLHEKELPPSKSLPGFNGLPQGSDEIEVWYPVLHGPNGEDGTVQGLFKLLRKPFVGSGVLASAMGLDKIAMKMSFAAAGLPQVPYCSANENELRQESSKKKLIHKLESQIGFPCFIKPANLGSSVGISKAHNREQLIYGLGKAAKLDNRLVVEKAVVARELECAVLGCPDLKVSVVGEVKFNSAWYDYETKYSPNSSQSLIPAPLSNNVRERVQKLTLESCKAISVDGMARVDFFYKDETDELWINEINTLPGFTSESMYPMLWKASGINLEQLVANLVETAKE